MSGYWHGKNYFYKGKEYTPANFTRMTEALEDADEYSGDNTWDELIDIDPPRVIEAWRRLNSRDPRRRKTSRKAKKPLHLLVVYFYVARGYLVFQRKSAARAKVRGRNKNVRDRALFGPTTKTKALRYAKKKIEANGQGSLEFRGKIMRYS